MTDFYLDFVLDQLSDQEGVQSRAMFGGHGLYCGGIFFGIVYNDVLYFKTDDSTRSDYETLGMKPFRPNPKQTLKNYFEVPADVLEDRDQLTSWTRKAVACQTDR